jgi:peptide/nickel transport system substrate-binding protein
MHRRIWFLVAAAVGVLALAGSATAMRTAGANGARTTARTGISSFAKSWAQVPRTSAARATKKTLVFGLEQTVTGFNLGDADENAYYASIVAGTPVIRGNYIIDQQGNYHLDMASKVVANKKYLRIYIKKSANWYWVGHKKLTPVTANDYVYTYKQIMDPANNVASNTGYANISRYKINNKKEVTFYWKKGLAFADYRDLFGYIYPGFALPASNSNGCGGGCTFNNFWHTCVCGSDNKPISDGPFYMSAYTAGQGMTLTKNPHWYGAKAKLNKVYFKMITDTNSEIQAMKGGEVDAINPSPESGLSVLVHQKNLKYSAVPSFTQEHMDIEVGPQGAALLKHQWMREAIAEALNRQGAINSLYGTIAPGLKPLNNTFYEIGTLANGKYAYFSKYNYNPKGAIKLLKSHGCTGGPSKPNANNSKVWSCGGTAANFRFDTTTRASRVTSGAIWKQNLKAIGISINDQYHDAGTFFGTILPSANFDLGEYAWIGGPDPSGFDAIYQCYNAQKNLGGSNYKRYCNSKVDGLIKKGDVNFNPTSRTAEYEQAAQITSTQVAVIPLYASPSIFVYKKAIHGMGSSNNATSEGPTWNIQGWSWG